MSELRVQSITGIAPNFSVTLEDGSTLDISSDLRVNGQSFVPVPSYSAGSQRKFLQKEGAIRFNQATQKIEVWHTPDHGTGQWCNIDSDTEFLTEEEATVRGSVGGGSGSGQQTTNNTIQVSTSADGSSPFQPYDLETGAATFTNYGQYVLRVAEATALKVELWGAGGGGASRRGPSRGSAGGYAAGWMILPSGDYTFIIGRGGEGGGTDMNDSVASGGYPDGGASDVQYSGESTAGGGGGSTRIGPLVSSNAINSSSTSYYLIAGAGGGGGDWVLYTSNRGGRQPVSNTEERGEGGGLTGGHGGMYYYADGSNSPGKGGGQAAGGAGGSGGRQGGGDAGGKYAGGNGGGGGGGGGYYGGGGGSGYYSQGGGGSGYVDTTANSPVKEYKLIRGGMGSQYTEESNTASPTLFSLGYSPLEGRPGNAGDGGTTSSNTETSRGQSGAVRFSLWGGPNYAETVVATGGDQVFSYGGYKYHVFTTKTDGNAGTQTISQNFVLDQYPHSELKVEYMMIAGGGGGGGGDVGGGGGAGGYRTNVVGVRSGGNSSPQLPMYISAGSYPVTVGDGGLGSNNSNNDGESGSNSSFNGVSVTGGGGGASWRSGAGRNGGSGGGSVNTSTLGQGSSNQGTNGGRGLGGSNYPEGGGGGVMSAGQSAPNQNNAGDGGKGIINPFGFAVRIGQEVSGNFWIGGGGGGGVESNATIGDGGKGGGGDGGRQNSAIQPKHGFANTGGGGGGNDGSSDAARGGRGGSGLVIVRYWAQPIPQVDPILSDLLFWYDMSTYTSGNTIEDRSPSGLGDATVTGSPSFNSKGNGSVNFNGGYASSPSWTAGSNGITMEVIMFNTSSDSTSTYGRIMDWRDTTLSLGSYNTRQFRNWVNAGGGRMSGEFAVNSSTENYFNTWNHAVMTYDKANVYGYWNGRRVFSVAKTGNLESGAAAFTIGNGDSNAYYGLIGTARAYSKGLTADEVTQNYKNFRGLYPR